jgi:cation transport ATPase
MLTTLSTAVLAAEEAHHEVNQALSWGIGAITLFILFALLFGLMMFGAGREHS